MIPVVPTGDTASVSTASDARSFGAPLAVGRDVSELAAGGAAAVSPVAAGAALSPVAVRAGAGTGSSRLSSAASPSAHSRLPHCFVCFLVFALHLPLGLGGDKPAMPAIIAAAGCGLWRHVSRRSGFWAKGPGNAEMPQLSLRHFRLWKEGKRDYSSGLTIPTRSNFSVEMTTS